jgi:hypothetical protein
MAIEQSSIKYCREMSASRLSLRKKRGTNPIAVRQRQVRNRHVSRKNIGAVAVPEDTRCNKGVSEDDALRVAGSSRGVADLTEVFWLGRNEATPVLLSQFLD